MHAFHKSDESQIQEVSVGAHKSIRFYAGRIVVILVGLHLPGLMHALWRGDQ